MIAPARPLTLRKTVIGGETAPDDYLVIWDQIPIGRILKQPGVPDRRPNWSWGVIVPTKPQMDWMRGTCSDLEECQRRFKVAWSAVHARMTDDDVEKLRQAEQRSQERPWKRRE